ncbi:MAG: DUF6602 domain-containing protein [Thermoleophilia bacterium]
MPDLNGYHESVTAELDAVKNRIRNLVRHWPTDGEWKEAALRAVLRRHLPSSALVARGFVVGRQWSSTQIDLMVLKPGKPTLFRDGDLAIVTPDVPGAVVEVKTSLNGPGNWYRVVKNLADHGQQCKAIAKNAPWLGVFSYEGDNSEAGHVLNALRRVHRETGVAINCVTSGDSLFIRYWPSGEHELGDDPIVDSQREYWRAYALNRLSASYFIGNLVDAVCDIDRTETDYAWFAHPGGKRPHILQEIRAEDRDSLADSGRS